MKKYISIDIGGTAIKYGIVSGDAESIVKERNEDRSAERRTGDP